MRENSYTSRFTPQRFWNTKRAAWILSKLAGRNKKVLDVGCGYGEILSLIPQHQRFGMDIDESRIRRLAAKGIRAKVITASAENLPYKDSFFDFVICSEVIEHVNNPGKTIREINRVLVPGGRLVLTTPNKISGWPILEKAWDFYSGLNYGEEHKHVLTPGLLKKFLQENNFEIEEFRTIFLLSPFVYTSRIYRVESRLLKKFHFGFLQAVVARKT